MAAPHAPSLDDLLAALDGGKPLPDAPPVAYPTQDDLVGATSPADEEVRETVEALDAASLNADFVVEANGTVRQAGASRADTSYVAAFKARAERSLYTFAKGILGRDYLTPTLHQPVCKWLTDFTAFRRKGLLLPREHAKSSIVSHALPLHILLQPKESNHYFPGESGAEQRIVLACVTADLAKKHLGVQRRVLERNALIKAFWGHRLWDKPSRDAPVWRDDRYTLPRDGDWPDPSVQAIGVDGAITGAHPSVLVKDDLIEIEAANSPVVMQTAIEWHKASRALVNKPSCLEFIIGTPWAVHDLYSEVLETDPTVEWQIRSAVEDGRILYPEGGFSEAKLAELQKDMGPLFLLLYMCMRHDPRLTDFDLSLLRSYSVDQGALVIAEDARDMLLAREADPALRIDPKVASRDDSMRGKTIDSWLAQYSEREKRRLPMLTKVSIS